MLLTTYYQCLYSIVAALQGWVDERNDPTQAIQYGDGSALDERSREALQSVERFMHAERVAFRWEAVATTRMDSDGTRGNVGWHSMTT